MRPIATLVLSLALASRALAWGPWVHEMVGQTGAEDAGLAAPLAVAVASGSLLADIDHTLKNAGVVGDSPAFARAVAQAHGASPLSDRFAAGLVAHALVQDPGQQEISSRDAKMCADMILVRTAGFPPAGAVFDAERLRTAALALSGTAPSARDLTQAAEKLLVLELVECAALDMVPLELDEARAQMPPALAHYERRMEESRRATAEVVAATLDELAAHVPAQAALPSHPADTVGLPPAALMGLAVTTRPIAGGLTLTTVRLTHPLLFKTAIRVVVHKLGGRLFPAAAAHWQEGARVATVTAALADHLAQSAARLEALFP